jgi:hypothetical protein
MVETLINIEFEWILLFTDERSVWVSLSFAEKEVYLTVANAFGRWSGIRSLWGFS